MNAVITAIAALFITFGTGLWRAKESVAAHNADINAIMDVLCEKWPETHACVRLGHASGEVANR